MVLVPARKLATPEAKREELRKHRIILMEKVGRLLCRVVRSADLDGAFRRWRLTTIMYKESELAKAATLVQTRARVWLAKRRARRLAQERDDAIYRSRRKIHEQFKYLTTEEERKAAGGGVTTNGKIYFATKHELNLYEDCYRRMAHRAFDLLIASIEEAKRVYFKEWVEHTSRLRELDVRFHFDPTMDDAGDGDSRPSVGGEADEDLPPRPSEIRLPPLPDTWCERDVHGNRKILNSAKHNSFMVKIAGPAPFAAWLVPGMVMMSAYPDGAVESLPDPRQKDVPVFRKANRDAAAGIVLEGIGNLICCCPEKEAREIERKRGMRPMEEVFERRIKEIGAVCKVAKDEAAHSVRIIDQEEKNCEMLRTMPGYSVESYRRILADVVRRGRVAREKKRRAETTMSLLPSCIKTSYSPFAAAADEDDLCAETEADEATMEVVRTVEDVLRRGERALVWSPRGHGRAAVVGAILLGRLYGCTSEEALRRVQLCHDARPDMEGVAVSAPQTPAQVARVMRLLVPGEGAFAPFYYRAARPSSDPFVSTREAIRGKSRYNVVFGKTKIVREEDLDDEEAQAAALAREVHRRTVVTKLGDDKDRNQVSFSEREIPMLLSPIHRKPDRPRLPPLLKK